MSSAGHFCRILANVFTFFYRGEHNLCAEPESVCENRSLVYVYQLGMAIVKLFEKLLLIIIECCQLVIVMVCDISHELTALLSAASAIGFGADVAVEKFFKNISHI